MGIKILALNASLRNARRGEGLQQLIRSVQQLENEEKLYEFLHQESEFYLQQFIEAGRKDHLPFDELYKNLRKQAGKRGLCNSEVGLVAALWSAQQLDCEVDYLPLSNFFTPNGKSKNLDLLKAALNQADGLLLSTPVYFGDRSSLASDFIDFIRNDEELKDSLNGKPFAGIAVGAKRNGGQETTLIYQLLDLINIGMHGVGNDSETTSQYGGTIHAGDIGTAAKDSYGIQTSMGTGRRLARVVRQLCHSYTANNKGKLRVMFWLLQDRDNYALSQVNHLIEKYSDTIEATVLKIAEKEVARCIACDICPIEHGADEEYRCIITRKADAFVQDHISFLDQDLIVPVAFSPKDRTGIINAYQRFIERTRYLRRGDYLFTDTMSAPLIFEELGSNENLHIRMMTSLIRHHTVVTRPNIAFIHENKILNEKDVEQLWEHTLAEATQLMVGHLKAKLMDMTSYNPVGYILSVAKDKEPSVEERRNKLHIDREMRRKKRAQQQISS